MTSCPLFVFFDICQKQPKNVKIVNVHRRSADILLYFCTPKLIKTLTIKLNEEKFYDDCNVSGIAGHDVVHKGFV